MQKTGSKKTHNAFKAVSLLQLALSKRWNVRARRKGRVEVSQFIFKEWTQKDILRVTFANSTHNDDKQTDEEQAWGKTGLKASECGF